MNRPGHPEGTLSYREAQGFIFTIACAPEMVSPSAWLPEIFGGGEPGFESKKEAGTILGGFMDLFNESLPAEGKEVHLPHGCAFTEDTMANLEPDSPVAEWCRGFITGHTWMMDCWSEFLPDEWDQDLAMTVIALSFFSSRQVAAAFVKESKKPDTPLEEVAELMREAMPSALADYSRMGQSLFEVVRDARTGEEDPLTPPQPGRNDPCICGSGRKYKKCCGGHVH